MDTTRELASFQGFIAQIVAGGQTELSPEEALDLWRERHPNPEQFDDDVQAIREALDDLEKGDPGIPLEDFQR